MAIIGETIARAGQPRGYALLGWLLLLLGGMWFAHKAEWIPASTGGRALFWPLLTMALGFFLLHSRRHRVIPSLSHQPPEVSHD